LTIDTASGVLNNDTDGDGDTLAALLVDPPTDGTLQLNSDGSFTYTPDTGFSGIDTFTYQADDGVESSLPATVTITVAPGNEFTVAENSAAGTPVGQTSPPAGLGSETIYEIDDPSVPAELKLAADDHLSGNPAASVVLIEYLDLQCPTCQFFHPLIAQLENDFAGDLLVVRRHFPLNGPHPNAFEAAQAAEAAHRQGMFDEMVDRLFDLQDDWAGESDPTPLFQSYATALGLNLTQFNADMADPAIADRINRDLAAALDLGAPGTPTFYLGGSQIPNLANYADFAELVQTEVDAADQPFTLDRLTGEIFVHNPAMLDFETDPTHTLDITVRNTAGAGGIVTVTVHLSDVAEAPVALGDTYETSFEAELNVGAQEGVLANDSDPDGDSLTAVIVAQPSDGTIQLNSDGSFIYTPNDEFSGTDSFTYTATDGTLTSETATVTIVVSDANTFSVAENSAALTPVGQVAVSDSIGGDLIFEIEDASVPAELKLAADDHLSGDPAASVVLVEYLDIQCPVCRTYHPLVAQLEADFQGDLLVVRRHYPLNGPHPNAFEAAQAAEAAHRQGMFREMVDMLFDLQGNWAGEGDPTPLFQSYATALGLNLTQFNADMADPAIADRINRDLAAALDLGALGTPTFYVDGTRITNPSSGFDFANVIQSAVTASVGPFTINRLTGELFVHNSAVLDFETTPTFTLNVTVRNVAGASETIPVTVNLTDVNESPAPASAPVDQAMAEEDDWLTP
jgi:protein-disulfide isomerase